MTVLLEYSDRYYNFIQMFNIAINIYFTLSYYAGIMLNDRRVPTLLLVAAMFSSIYRMEGNFGGRKICRIVC